MLLPSALPCDLLAGPTRCSKRPKLPTFDTYSPPPQSSYTGSGSIMASCRALQNVLGAYMPTSSPQLRQLTIPQPLKQSPFAPQRLQSPPQLFVPSRGANKRSRDEFEGDMVQHEPNELFHETTRDIYQTPKRQRRVPDEIPRGLKPSDFHSLYTPPQQMIQRQNTELEMPPLSIGVTPQSHLSTALGSPIQAHTRQNLEDDRYLSQGYSKATDGWSPTDDRRLVAAVLSKLNLSTNDWNACARQLGKDKDTLGRRWKLLVGEGNIVLRKGSGKLHGRTDLDIASW